MKLDNLLKATWLELVSKFYDLFTTYFRIHYVFWGTASHCSGGTIHTEHPLPPDCINHLLHLHKAHLLSTRGFFKNWHWLALLLGSLPAPKLITSPWPDISITSDMQMTDKNRLGYFLPSAFALEQTAPRGNRRLTLSKKQLNWPLWGHSPYWQI